MSKIVATYIVIYNMYTIGKDNFDTKLIEEVERELDETNENRSS